MNSPFRIEDHLEAQDGRNNLPVANFKPFNENSSIRPPEIGKGNSLCLCSWNCYLTAGYFDLLQLIEKYSSKFDVGGICETFLNSDQSYSAYFFPGCDFEVRN